MPDETAETKTSEVLPASEFFHVLDQETVDKRLEKVKKEIGIDLDPNSVSLVRPGDYLFDFNEIQYKLTQKYGDLEKVEEILTQYGFGEEEKLDRESIKKIAEDEKINLNGELPGFAMTTGNEIIFFAIKRGNTVDMANRYAQKEGINEQFISQTDAENF
jgi:hypothetical protein